MECEQIVHNKVNASERYDLPFQLHRSHYKSLTTFERQV